jgi:hypothetical protein
MPRLAGVPFRPAGAADEAGEMGDPAWLEPPVPADQQATMVLPLLTDQLATVALPQLTDQQATVALPLSEADRTHEEATN